MTENNQNSADQNQEPKAHIIKIIGVNESELTMLLDRIREYEAKEDQIAAACTKALNVFGLIDPNTGEVIQELKEGTGVMGIIISKLKDQISISDMMFNKSKFEKEISEKFSFFSELMPIFQSYADRKRQQQQSAV